MKHPLEDMYGLTAYELLEALSHRFRAKVTLEGAVSEVHMEKQIKPLVGSIIERYEVHDQDGRPDFSIWLPDSKKPLLAECKNVRNTDEAYRSGGKIVAYKVETQKTRAAKGDPTSRYYGEEQFDILGVCLGKKTHDWTNFMYLKSTDLLRHRSHKGKLAVMQRVPLPDAEDMGPWFENLGDLLQAIA